MEDGKIYCEHVNLILHMISLIREPVIGLMEQRFRNTIKEQTNTNPRRKQHGEVRYIIELWFDLLGSELDMAIPESKPDHEELKIGVFVFSLVAMQQISSPVSARGNQTVIHKAFFTTPFVHAMFCSSSYHKHCLFIRVLKSFQNRLFYLHFQNTAS